MNFLRAGQILGNDGTLINILTTTRKRNGPQGRIWEFFLLDTL